MVPAGSFSLAGQQDKLLCKSTKFLMRQTSLLSLAELDELKYCRKNRHHIFSMSAKSQVSGQMPQISLRK